MRWFRGGSKSLPPPPAPSPWSLDGVPRPWTDPSLLAWVEAGLGADGRLRDGHEILPDEPPDTGQLRWSPGALDGVVTSHTQMADPSQAEAAVASIGALARHADATTLAATTEALRTIEVLPVIDQVLRDLAPNRDRPDGARISAIGRMYAYEGPERGLVKYGIGLVGILGDLSVDETRLTSLGTHQEFTLFVAVALTNLGAGDRSRWALAKRVRGWGRIQLVRRLVMTSDPEIRAWMLRDGFRNDVMDEYLALDCAVGGELAEALAEKDIDDALYDGASDILIALARGGPAGDLSDYTDRHEAVERWLEHVERRGPNIKAIATLDELAGTDTLTPYLDDWINTVRSTETARGVVREALQSDDPYTFALALAAAHVRGIDAFDRTMARAAAGDRYATFDLFKTVDAAHLDGALQLMRGRLDLDALASGPGNELGLGLAFQDHSDLESVVVALERFPGQGTDFVLACLRSPVIRGRLAAARTIGTWGPGYLTPELRTALETSGSVEPIPNVREAIAAAQAGAAEA